VSVSRSNKKFRYREEYSASVMLSWCTSMTFLGENLSMANQPLHLSGQNSGTWRTDGQIYPG